MTDNLNQEQKQLLNEWFIDNNEHLTINFDLQQCEQFSYELYEQLINIKDYEQLYQDINRYIINKVMELN
jgi:hypothetical protein